MSEVYIVVRTAHNIIYRGQRSADSWSKGGAVIVVLRTVVVTALGRLLGRQRHLIQLTLLGGYKQVALLCIDTLIDMLLHVHV